MKTTVAEPFELFTTPVPGGGPAATRTPTAEDDQVELDVEPDVEPDVLGLDPAATLGFLVEQRRQQDVLAARELRGICHWADLHRVKAGHEWYDGGLDPALTQPSRIMHLDRIGAAARSGGYEAALAAARQSAPGVLGTEGELRLAGQGCFMVAEFAITQLAAELGMTEAGARGYVGESVELRDRLPKLWGRVMDGTVPAWKGRRVARETIPLTAEAAAYVDAHLAPFAGKLSLTRILRVVHAATVRHDPDRAARLAAEAAEQRGVWVDHGPNGPDDLPVATGTSRLEATVDTPDAVAFEDAVAALAASLGELGHTGSLNVRRAKAVGVLADPQHALDLTAAADTNRGNQANENGTAAGSSQQGPMHPKARQPKRLGGTVLHIHLHTAAICGHDSLAAGDGLGPVARIEQHGPRPAAVVQQWLADLAPGAKVTVTPVVDLAEQISVDAHEAPQRLRDQCHHLDMTCVFPWCGRDGRYDLDHIEEYLDPNEGGRPGQTNSGNLAKLCRFHHRVKTHTPWRYRREPDRSLTWTSPLGKQYRVDHTGTARIPDPTIETCTDPDCCPD